MAAPAVAVAPDVGLPDAVVSAALLGAVAARELLGTIGVVFAVADVAVE